MPLELGIWRIDDGLEEVQASTMDQEARLEDILAKDISIASPNWMIIGRQVHTEFGGYIDLLAIDRDGNLIVVELKKHMTPREVVAQLLDYASWVRELKAEKVSRIFEEYQEKYIKNGAVSLDEAFCARFKVSKLPDTINEDHELVVVAAALDDSTERIVTYLSEAHGVPVNAVFFRVFKDGDREYLTRAWFRDPTESSSVEESPAKGNWNGEYYSSFGNDYAWESARKYGYIVAGGGTWYSSTLFKLERGGRVWVNSPANGYLGVGVVEEGPVKADLFMVKQDDGSEIPITEISDADSSLGHEASDTEKANYVVRVKWLNTVSFNEAISERGFFGNQHSVCRPRTEKWEHTVNRLKKRFDVE